MKREDFVCAVGFQGDTAIVDGAARKKYGRRKADELLEDGMLRYAFCAALYDGELEALLEPFAAATGIEAPTTEVLKRLFGVFSVPEGSVKVKVVS
jgi:hypothetical protein